MTSDLIILEKKPASILVAANVANVTYQMELSHLLISEIMF